MTIAGRDRRVLKPIEWVAQVAEPPREPEKLELTLPERGDQGNLGGDQLGDQARGPERMQERLVDRAKIDERP